MKSESERRKTNLFSESARCAWANPFRHAIGGAVVLSGEDAAPLPQQLRRIDAIFAPKEAGELGRTAEAVLSGDPGQRLRLAGAQHLLRPTNGRMEGQRTAAYSPDALDPRCCAGWLVWGRKGHSEREG